MIGIIFFLIRMAVFILAIYLIYFFYKSLRRPTQKKPSKKTTDISCPSAAILVDYTNGKIKGRKKQQLYNHIANCKDCQYALQAMFDMPREEGLKKNTSK